MRFNPHPARRPGATTQTFTRLRTPMAFQSSPGPKAGCYVPSDACYSFHCMEFQSSPGPKAGCYGWRRRACRWMMRFQSSPGPKAGCYSFTGIKELLDDVFQSSPGPKAGCYAAISGGRVVYGLVSILTRPEGRVLPTAAGGVASTARRFNPHPARRPGATELCPPIANYRRRFNPHPARRPGATPAAVVAQLAGRSFNPHPARRPGATPSTASRTASLPPVSILTRPEGRVLPIGRLPPART